jgi:hypothetical protein
MDRDSIFTTEAGPELDALVESVVAPEGRWECQGQWSGGEPGCRYTKKGLNRDTAAAWAAQLNENRSLWGGARGDLRAVRLPPRPWSSFFDQAIRLLEEFPSWELTKESDRLYRIALRPADGPPVRSEATSPALAISRAFLLARARG